MLKFLTVNNILAPSNIGTFFFWNPLCVPKVCMGSGLKMFSNHFLCWETGFPWYKVTDDSDSCTMVPASLGGCSSHWQFLPPGLIPFCCPLLAKTRSVCQSSKDLLIRVKQSSFPFLQRGSGSGLPSDVRAPGIGFFCLLRQHTDKTRR